MPRAQNQRADLLSKQALEKAAYSPPKGRQATVVIASDDEPDEDEP